MERKTKIELSLALAIIMAFIWLLVWWTRRPVEVPATPATTQTSVTTSKEKTKTTTTQPTTETSPSTPVVVETSPTTVARTFVERLGSYSSEADAANIDDIMVIATTSFQKQLQSLAKAARASSGDAYYGVSTRMLTTPKTVSESDTVVVLSTTTQRIETIDTPGNTSVKYQSITITLVKSGTTWLVDGYSWTDGV